MPEEKLLGFYNVLKSSGLVEGLPDNYDTFKKGLSNPENAKGFYEAIRAGGVVEGLPDSFESFSTGLGLGKPSAAPQPGGGGGLSSPKAPGMDGGRSPFGMGSVAQKIGQPPIAQQPTIPPSEFGITSVGGKIGKPMPAQPIDKGMAKMPTVEGPQKYDLSGLPSMEQSSRQGDINAMMPEIKLSVPPETMEMKPSGKLVYNPLKDYQRRTEEIEKEADVDRQTIKKKELWEDVAKYSQEDNKEIENFLTQSLPQMQQMQANFDNVVQALQDPQLPEDQRNALQMQAEELQGVLQNNATEMQKMEAKYKSNAALSAQLLKASKGLKYNDATPLEIVSKEVWNGTVPAIIKSVGGLLEAGGKAPGGMPSLIDPETGEIINPTFLQSVGSALITGANDMQAEYQSTDSDVSVLDDLNAANISKLAGSVLSSFAIAAGTGGLGAAPQAIAIGGQIFGNTYEQAKEAGLTPEQAAAFAIIPTLVGAKLAPYGVESVAAKLLNPSSKAALKEAIKSVGKQGGAKKALELGKEWAKNVFFVEGTTGAIEAGVQYSEEAAFQQLPNIDFGNDETLKGFMRAVGEGYVTEAAGAGILQTFLTAVPRKKLSDIASAAMKDPAKETKFFDDLKSLLNNNDINQQQFDAVSDFYQKAKAAAAQVPPTVTNPQQSARATELIQEQQELQAQIEQTNPAMVAPLVARLDEVNAELGNIAEGKEAPAEAAAEEGIPLGTAASQALISKGEKLGFTKEQVNSMTAEERDVIRTASSKDDVKDLADKYAEQVVAAEATPQAGVVEGEVEIKNEGKADAPTKESVTERLNINNPFYQKVEDALVKLGLIEKYNPETGTGDVVGGYAQQTSDGGFSAGKMLFSQDGSISYFDGAVKVSFDKNGNVISENTKESKQKAVSLEIESKKESIANLEKTRDSEAFKYKEVTETDVLGNKKKVKRLKTPQELKESTDKINAAIDKAKNELTQLEKSTPQAGSVVGIEAEGKAKKIEEPTKEQQLKDVQEGNVATFTYETEKDVPDVFKDKISSTGEINGKPVVRVTVAKSLADYELSRQQAARAEEQQPAAERKPEAAPTAEGTRVQAEAGAEVTASDFESYDKTGKAGRKARQQIREQYGTDTAAKMEYITKNFEEAITNLEKQGKIRKICP